MGILVYVLALCSLFGENTGLFYLSMNKAIDSL